MQSVATLCDTSFWIFVSYNPSLLPFIFVVDLVLYLVIHAVALQINFHPNMEIGRHYLL